MQIYFLRHGLADSNAWSGDDFSRPLTPEGKDIMKASAKTMKAMELKLDRILSSPLTRALQTAEIVGRWLGVAVEEDERLAGGFGLKAVTEMFGGEPNDASIMVVGHEPTFSDTIGRLIGGGAVTCRKGSLARVDLYSLSPPRGHLAWMIPPRLLALQVAR